MLGLRTSRCLLVGSWLCLVVSCHGSRASTVPLGGKHEEEPVAARKRGGEESSSDSAALPERPEAKSSPASEPKSEPTASAAPTAPSGPAAPPSAFQVKPYALHQAWTRVVDLEIEMRLAAAGMNMTMTSHQEVRFEVLGASAGHLDKLRVEYSVYTSKVSMMGNSQDSPEELAGKRFVITWSGGKPDVRDDSGRTPPKKQLDSVNDDAREPLEIEKSLRELSDLSAKGKTDFSPAGAISLAGGEDDDTKVTAAHAMLRRVTADKATKTAWIEVGYTLTNALDDQSTLEAQVSGSLSVIDGPARYAESQVKGPMEIRSSDPGGMQGKGTIKVTTSYRY